MSLSPAAAVVQPQWDPSFAPPGGLSPAPPRPVDESEVGDDAVQSTASGTAAATARAPSSPPQWSREQDNRLRLLRAHLDTTGSLEPLGTDAEFRALEREYDVFEAEGMRKLLGGQTPEQHHRSAQQQQQQQQQQRQSASPASAMREAASSAVGSVFDVLSAGGKAISRAASNHLPSAREAARAGWFWTSLVGTAAPGFIGRKLGLTDRYDHWNWIVPYTAENRQGGLILGALPVMTEVMGSGNHLKALRAECAGLGATMGMVVSCLLPQEMDGFGVDMIKFATHADWVAEFGPTFETRILPVEDNSADGMSYELVMRHLTEVNRVMATGGSVYVHCKAGKGRSWAFVICYLIVFRGMSVEDAMLCVKSCRHQVGPSSSQIDFVRAFHAAFAHSQRVAEEERASGMRTSLSALMAVAHNNHGEALAAAAVQSPTAARPSGEAVADVSAAATTAATTTATDTAEAGVAPSIATPTADPAVGARALDDLFAAPATAAAAAPATEEPPTA